MSKETIPLSFHDYIDVDSPPESQLRILKGSAKKDPAISESEITVVEEPVTRTLKEKLFDRAKNIATDPYFSVDLQSHITEDIKALDRFEKLMVKGASLILNNSDKPGANFNKDEALHWFCRLMKSKIMYVLWSTQIPKEKNPNVIEFDKKTRVKWNSAYLMSNTMAEEFYDIAETKRLVIGNKGLGYGGADDFSFWVDRKLPGVVDLLEYQLPEQANNVLSTVDFSKFVIPQMLAYVEPDKHIWSLENKVIAIP